MTGQWEAHDTKVTTVIASTASMEITSLVMIMMMIVSKTPSVTHWLSNVVISRNTNQHLNLHSVLTTIPVITVSEYHTENNIQTSETRVTAKVRVF